MAGRLTTYLAQTIAKGKECCVLDMGNSNLDTIRKLTAELQDYGDHAFFESPSVLRTTLEKGEGVLIGLYKVDKVAVARSFVKGDTQWPPHYHEAWEYFIVYDGEMHVEFRPTDCRNRIEKKNGTNIIKAPGIFYLSPRTLHSVYFPVDSHLILITVPSAEGFPDGAPFPYRTPEVDS